jgi:hypothetical protein
LKQFPVIRALSCTAMNRGVNERVSFSFIIDIALMNEQPARED